MCDLLEEIIFFEVVYVVFFGGLLLTAGIGYLLFPSLRAEIVKDWKGEINAK